MRRAFAHLAELRMDPAGDLRAPGAAITVALCGHWEHEPPCPLAPHYSEAARVGGDVHVRTLFAVEPDLEDAMRRRIDDVLSAGRLHGPTGLTTCWELRGSSRSDVTVEESAHARRLIES